MLKTVDVDPQLRRIIQAADPTYRKRKCVIVVNSRVELSGTYWSGGSRDTYTAVDIATGRSKGSPQYDPPQFGGPATAPVVQIPDGVAIVRTGIFCGRTSVAFIHVNERTIAPLLPQ